MKAKFNYLVASKQMAEDASKVRATINTCSSREQLTTAYAYLQNLKHKHVYLIRSEWKRTLNPFKRYYARLLEEQLDLTIRLFEKEWWGKYEHLLF